MLLEKNDLPEYLCNKPTAFTLSLTELLDALLKIEDNPYTLCFMFNNEDSFIEISYANEDIVIFVETVIKIMEKD